MQKILEKNNSSRGPFSYLQVLGSFSPLSPWSCEGHCHVNNRYNPSKGHYHCPSILQLLLSSALQQQRSPAPLDGLAQFQAAFSDENKNEWGLNSHGDPQRNSLLCCYYCVEGERERGKRAHLFSTATGISYFQKVPFKGASPVLKAIIMV